jgi:hypothetical protein
MGGALVDRLRLKFPELGPELQGREHHAAREALPFYRRHGLVTLTIQARATMVHRYLDDGVDFLGLNGTFGPLAAANAREALQLVPQHAEPYARFALRHGLGAKVVERPEHVEWHHKADAEARAPAVRALRPLRLVISPEGGFEVTAVLREGESLVEARYRVALDGRVQALGTRTLVERIPLARPPV